MIREILQDGNPILRQVAQPITEFGDEIERLAADMLETLQSVKGIGLAAPQVGVSLRLIVIDVGGIKIAMANPVIRYSSGQQRSVEGCLSVPLSLWDQPVARAANLDVEYQEVCEGEFLYHRSKGLRAACIQHEIDHLDGVLFMDRVSGARSNAR